MLPVRLFQERQRLSPCTARIQRDGVDIAVARVVGYQLMGPAQQIQGPGIIVLAHQKKTEGVADVGIVRLDSRRLSQQLRPLVIPAARPVEIGEVDEGRDEIRVETQCRAIFRFRFGWLPTPQIQQPEVEVSLRLIGIDHLGSDKLGGGLYQGGLLFRR